MRNQRADGTFLARPESGDDFPFGKAPSGKRCDRLLESGDAERQRISDGSVEIDKVLESPHPKMSYRVKKIILSTSGKWIPALYFGAPVRQKFVLPVDFRLR